MSQSAAPSVSNGAENANKKRRLGGPEDGMSMAESPSGVQPQTHIPKRGARACTNCRKGKNRCEGEVSSLFLAVSPSRSLTNGPPPPSRPGSLSSLSSLLASVVKRVARPAYSKSQRRKMCRPKSRGQVPSTYSIFALPVMSHTTSLEGSHALRASSWCVHVVCPRHLLSK